MVLFHSILTALTLMVPVFILWYVGRAFFMLFAPPAMVAGKAGTTRDGRSFNFWSRLGALSADWKQLTTRQKATTALVVAGFFTFMFWLQASYRSGYQQTLRAQFHLPEETEFSSFAWSRKLNPRRPRVAGIVHMSEAQFQAYAAQLDNPAVWVPVPLDYDGTTITGSYSAKSMRWTHSPAIFAGDRRARWGAIESQYPAEMPHGRHFCYAIQAMPIPAAGSTSPYKVSACDELGRDQRTVGIMKGALDFDTRTLYMVLM